MLTAASWTSRQRWRTSSISAKQGVSKVVVAPIAVPQADGAVKLGAGAAPAEASPEEVQKATSETSAATAR